MAYVLEWEDDWSSYGTDTEAVEDAYPVWDESDPPFALSGGTVGPTVGPNGGPGIADLAGNAGLLPKHIPMNCREFKIEILADYTDWTGPGLEELVECWYGSPYSPLMDEFSDTLLSISHGVTGNIVVQIGSAGSLYNSGSVVGVVPTSGTVQWRIEGRLSTISGSPGSFTAASDGYILVYVNDVLVVDSGAIEFWHDDANIPSINPAGSWTPYWNIVEVNAHGRVGLYRVYSSDSCLVTPRRNFYTGKGHHGTTCTDVAVFGEGGTLQEKERVVLMALSDAFEWDGENGCLVVKGNLHLFGQLILHGGTLATGGLPIQMDPDEHALSLAGYAPTITGGPLGPAPAPDALAFTGLAPTLVRAHRASMSAGSIGITGRAPTVTVA
jgi:hypothetical protein